MKPAKSMQKFLTLILAAVMLFSLAACAKTVNTSPSDVTEQPTSGSDVVTTPGPATDTDITADSVAINFGVLKGPTGMGAVFLMDDVSNGTYDYNITLGTAPTEFTSMLISGELDIAAVPTNLAATLYNKTNGGVKMLMLNTLGVLYIMENGESIKSISDLKGRTLYATGQASNPEYVLNYILKENGLEPGKDVTIEWRDSDELVTLMATGEIDLCMLPVPASTTVTVKNSNVRYALSLTDEWDALNNGSKLTQGCIVVRSEFYNEHPEAVKTFLERYYNSVTAVMEFIIPSDKSNVNIGELLAKHEIVGNAAIGNAALPYTNICDIFGKDMKPSIEGYFEVLFNSDPTSIGGAIPGDDFYCDTGFETK